MEVLFHVRNNGLDYNILINTIYEQLHNLTYMEHWLTTPSWARASSTRQAAVVIATPEIP